MKAAIVVFPGTNREAEMKAALEGAGATTELVWHGDGALPACDLLVLPGGFSYGDYLRCGAMAARSPAMAEVARRARAGRPVLGVCNGFQMLIEAGLLPGALLRNAGLDFVCRDVHLRLENPQPLTGTLKAGATMRVPVAHGEGNYTADAALLRRLRDSGRIVFRYVAGPGEPAWRANPNGSSDAIAAIANRAGNVLGMMPHPENASLPRQGSGDGAAFFRALVEAVEALS